MLRQFLPVVCLVTVSAFARDLYVDPNLGDEKADGLAAKAEGGHGPVKTIARGIKYAQPGDTVHLAPVVFRESVVFYNREGEPEKPITLDGHGAVLEGSELLDPAAWTEVTPGLFRCDSLLRHDDAVIQRWYFLWDGRMNHMGRTSKGHRDELKKPEDLQPGEWTYVKAAEQPPPEKHAQTGSFYVKLPPGQKLADAKISAPMRSAGVQFSGTNRWLVVRHLTATHVYNDGYNIHGHCDHVVFEDIRAIECGDDGISAHETAQYEVRGLVSIGNSTGICDTGESQTSYERVYIRDCLAAGVMFMDSGKYSVRDSLIESSVGYTFSVGGRTGKPATLAMENVLIRRAQGSNEVRIGNDTIVTARRCTFEQLNVHASKSTTELTQSVVVGTPQPQLIIGPEVQWTAGGNFYDLKSVTLGARTFTADKFSDYQKLSGQDSTSTWAAGGQEPPSGLGADRATLEKLALPPGPDTNAR